MIKVLIAAMWLGWSLALLTAWEMSEVQAWQHPVIASR